MALFRETVVKWGGKEYSFVSEMAFINRIEDHVAVMPLQHKMFEGEIKVSKVVYILQMAYAKAGQIVDDTEIMVEVMDGNEEVMESFRNVMASIFPERPQKKAEAPAD